VQLRLLAGVEGRQPERRYSAAALESHETTAGESDERVTGG